MSNRLPKPGGDVGDWGAILNDYLEVSHNSDGTLKSNAITSAGGYNKPSSGIPATDLSASVQTSLTQAANAVQLAGDLGGTTAAPTVSKLQGATLNGSFPSNGQVLTYDGTANAWVPGTPSSTTVNDATTSSKGIVELAGDLGGTASSPSVLQLNGITAPGSAPTTGQVLTATSGTASSWSTPASAPVTSVAGKTGAVTLVESDIANLISDLGGKLTAANNLSDVSSASSARTNLGLGTAATISSTAGGDLSGTLPSPTVAKLKGVTAPASAPTGAGQVLTSTSTSASTWQTPSSAPVTSVFGRTGTVTAQSGDYTAAQVGALSATATAGGDLTGNYPNPTVAKVNGISVTGTPSNGQVLTASSSSAASWSSATTGTTDWLNVVTQYSADPTGTNDSTTAIQNAITAAQNLSNGGSKGGVVYFPAGKYKISSALSITSESITLLGDGGGSEYYGNPVKIVQTSTTANALTVSNAWNIIIKGLAFIGPGSGSGYGLHLTYTSVPAGFNAMEDVYVTGFGSDGVYVNGSVMSTFVRVWSTGNTGYGINVSGTSCSFNSCWAPGNTAGGWLASGTYHSWNGCGADGNVGPGWTLSGCQSCNISGSGSEDNTGYALYLTASCYTCTINGFWCSNNSIGLQIDASCYRIIVSGFLENALNSPQYSIQIGNGAIVTLIDPQVTTATNFPSGGSYINQITDNGLTVSGTVSAGTLNGKVVDATGITGATAASRYVGATTSGSPSSGTFSKGDFVIDQTAKIWVCTTAGTVGSGAVFMQVAGPATPLTISQQSASYTFAAIDAGTELEYTGTSAGTFTIPQSIFSVGQTFNVRQASTGSLTIAAGSGVTMHAPNGALLAQQWSTATIICRATNEFVLNGDTSTT